MNYDTKFGVSQGRLVESESGQLQCFPQSGWMKEFAIAEDAGLSFIELLIERNVNKLNPFWSIDGRNKIKDLTLEHNLELYSCCFDYIIDHDLSRQDTTYKSILQDFFNACDELAIPVIVFPMLEESSLTKQNYKDFVPLIQDIADKFLCDSKELCLESILPAAELADFLDMIDRNNVSCVYDTGNRVVDGTDLVCEIHLLNNRIKHFHIKDKNDGGENVILGTGLVNFYEVFEALRSIGYKGHFNFETTRGRFPKKTIDLHLYIAKFFCEEVLNENT